jgi:hypothetical protein
MQVDLRESSFRQRGATAGREEGPDSLILNDFLHLDVHSLSPSCDIVIKHGQVKIMEHLYFQCKSM